MRRLGGTLFWPVFLATAPSILIDIRTGQNGLLIGGAEALSALLLLRQRPIGAGLALAGLALKPHLGLLVPVALALQRRWLTLASAAIAGLAVTGLGLLVFGPKVFGAFLGSLSEVGPYMAAGAYPLHRMTSLYASLLAAGVPNTPALMLHGCIAATLLGLTLWVSARSKDARLQLGLAMMAGLFVSPYLYDYDLPVFGVGLMLVAPTMVRRLTARRYAGLLLAIALSAMPGMVVDALGIRASLGGPMMLGCCCAVLWVAASARQQTSMAQHAACAV